MFWQDWHTCATRCRPDKGMTMENANNTGNRVLPPGGQFCAIVDGKPTGLAGCTRGTECARAAQCLRANPGLRYRADLGNPATCAAFIRG